MINKGWVNSRGFTLVEVMIATLVFAVGMMAVISMEFSSIRAYTSGRDLTVATDLSTRTVALMRAEGAVWSQMERPEDVLAMPSNYKADSAVDPDGTSKALLRVMAQNPWEWQVVTKNPVNAQYQRGLTGRYCVYVRGGISTQSTAGKVVDVAGTPTTVTPLMQAQVAVVYPGGQQSFGHKKGTLKECDVIPGCSGTAVSLLNPKGLDLSGSGADSLPKLEQCGWRAMYSGAMISRTNG